MKKILVLFAFVAISTIVMAQEKKGVNFESATLTELLAKSAKDNKPVFIDIYTTWCPPCKYMTNSVFTEEAAGKFFNKKFINAKFDAEKGEGIEVAQKYSVKAYPTFLIINSKGEEIGRIVGASETEKFIERVNEVMKTQKK